MASGVDGTVKENISPYNPIPGATVVVVETNYSGNTDANGQYNIAHPDGIWTVRASATGYVSKEKTVTIPVGGYAHAHFKLNLG
ncbi:MAG: carboxypeptidase-like regulatory domain-containing protein [Candidatus Brocadiaceae bacterium]